MLQDMSEPQDHSILICSLTHIEVALCWMSDILNLEQLGGLLHAVYSKYAAG